MKVKEYYYEEAIIQEIKETFSCSRNRATEKLYTFILKKKYNADEVAIDFERKIAYLQFSHAVSHTDERLLRASTKIVEMHFSSLRQLVLNNLEEFKQAY
ncbi:hypothetical protein [Mesonia aquimarina]|uniref:hypothetical protein n=1 Tax=Mesonia aquimarina TaxID=1504967 RepID=UPI000EF5D465|nr:hypothetical protein [Mesonia aquimarina]